MRNKFLKYWILGFLSLIFISCQKNNLYSIINDKYSQCTETKERCIIDFDKDLNSLIKEDWDTVYITEANLPILDSFTGKDDFLFSETMPKILFVKDKKVIYQEGFDSNIGQDRQGLLLDFNFNPYLVVDRKNSKFLILPMSKDDIHYTKDALYIKYCK